MLFFNESTSRYSSTYTYYCYLLNYLLVCERHNLLHLHVVSYWSDSCLSEPIAFMSDAPELSPEEKARQLRLAAAEKRLQKNALPKTLRRPTNPIAAPVNSRPLPQPAELTSQGSKPTPPVGATPAPPPAAAVLLGQPASTTDNAENPASPQQEDGAATGDAKPSIVVGKVLPSNPTPPPQEGGVAGMGGNPSRNDEATNPILAAVLRRQEKNKMPKLGVQLSASKKRLLSEIELLLKSRGEEPNFGLPMATEEQLEKYLSYLQAKYHVPSTH